VGNFPHIGAKLTEQQIAANEQFFLNSSFNVMQIVMIPIDIVILD
jgi:hypothetical protein